MRLNEILNEIVVFHGSDSNIDKFDPERVGSASGLDKGGWGFYFTDDESVAGQYASGQGSVEQYQIPNGPYLNLDDGVDLGFLQTVYDEMEEREVDDSDLEEFRTDFMDESYMYDTTIEQVYNWLGYVVGSRKNASMFFKYLGYVGTQFADKTNSDATNYVVFDADDIRRV